MVTPRQDIDWGSLRRLQPVSDCYGFDRGDPVDRYYIAGFMRRQSELIRGEVMEIRAPQYTNTFRSGVTRSHVVDIDPANPEATLIADLTEPGSLPEDAYDCVILTQTLQYLGDEGAALRNIYVSLRPGGVCLITAPSLARIDHELPDADYWRYTPPGLLAKLQAHCPHATVSVEGHGNVLTGIAFLMGLAVQELREDELTDDDPAFPLVVCASVKKPERPPPAG
jgi:SAM-dependent methyltransferase